MNNDQLPKSRKDALGRGVTRYFTGKPCPAGHIEPRWTRSSTCVICSYVKSPKGWYKRNPKAYLLVQARKRSKTKGLPFTLTEDDIIIPSQCPFLGIPLKFGDRTQCDNSPSIHRVDNTRGYTPDNILVISYRANRIINDAVFEEFETIYNKWKTLIA